MLIEALRAPARAEGPISTIVIGSLLLGLSVGAPILLIVALLETAIWILILPLAVFPPLILMGYEVRVIDAAARDDDVPAFVDWQGLLRDGCRSLLIRVGYAVPLFAICLIAGGGVALLHTVSLADTTVNLGTAGLVLFGLLAGLCYLLVYSYLLPAGLAVLATTGRVRPAFSSQVSHLLTDSGFALSWCFASLVLLVGLTVALPLQVLVVGFMIAFYTRIVANYLLGIGAREHEGSTDEPASGTPEQHPSVDADVPPPVQVGKTVVSSADDRVAPEIETDG